MDIGGLELFTPLDNTVTRKSDKLKRTKERLSFSFTCQSSCLAAPVLRVESCFGVILSAYSAVNCGLWPNMVWVVLNNEIKIKIIIYFPFSHTKLNTKHWTQSSHLFPSGWVVMVKISSKVFSTGYFRPGKHTWRTGCLALSAKLAETLK